MRGGGGGSMCWRVTRLSYESQSRRFYIPYVVIEVVDFS